MEKIADGVLRSDAFLKTLFENGDKPTEDDFADLIESKAHKKEVFLKKDEVSNDDIDTLIEQLLNTTNKSSNAFVIVDNNKSNLKENVVEKPSVASEEINKKPKTIVKKAVVNNTGKNNKKVKAKIKK